MKTLFICAGLEPRKDGVGDYTRKLAGELLKRNKDVAIIAMNDRFIAEGFSEGCQTDEGIKITVLRFSHLYPWVQKIAKAKIFIEAFRPDWISLQYVPYGFNKKGLPFYLPRVMKQLKGSYNWHIMFHEMWVGISRLSPLKHKFYGFFQKKICVSLVKHLKPEKISTTNRLYQLVLMEKNISAHLLPLFSNIPLHPADETFLNKIEKKHHVVFSDPHLFVIGVFGTLYPYATLYSEIPKFLKQLRHNGKVLAVFFGRNNHPLELEKIKQVLNESVQIIELGELNTSEVSTIFSVLHQAVLCTPGIHIGKSGAYAALRFHNIKVLTPSSQPIPKYEQEITNYNLGLEKKPSAEWSVRYITGEFISYLENDV